MERMNLRQAAERCARSITTLRRYIRSGRLEAEKQSGRYGPEYFVTAEQLEAAGLELGAGKRSTAIATRRSSSTEYPHHAGVPLSLFQELQMKHEQLLVQYGMIRAGGLRVMGQQSELEARKQEIDTLQQQNSRLQKQLQEARLELEGKDLEVEALLSKVRSLEMLSRNAVTNETIEKQFSQLADQTRRVEELSSRGDWRPPRRHKPPEH
jgi:hypothetical protein